MSAHHVVGCHLNGKVMIWVTIHRRRWSEGYAAPDSYGWILTELQIKAVCSSTCLCSYSSHLRCSPGGLV